MDVITFTKDKRTHFWVPVTGLVTEVYASFKHLAHSSFSHVYTFKIWGLTSMYPSHRLFESFDSTPTTVTVHV
jgi:hypothetical protein